MEGVHRPVHLNSCYRGTVVVDWWRGIFHSTSTLFQHPIIRASIVACSGIWLAEVSPIMLWLITPASACLLMDSLHCKAQHSPPLHSDCVPNLSGTPCTTLIIIFIDEYRCRQDDEVAICVQRLSHENTKPGLCHCWEICSSTDLSPLWLSNFEAMQAGPRNVFQFTCIHFLIVFVGHDMNTYLENKKELEK